MTMHMCACNAHTIQSLSYTRTIFSLSMAGVGMGMGGMGFGMGGMGMGGMAGVGGICVCVCGRYLCVCVCTRVCVRVFIHATVLCSYSLQPDTVCNQIHCLLWGGYML